MSRIDRLTALIDGALADIESEIEKSRSGRRAIDTLDNLEFISSRLRDMRSDASDSHGTRDMTYKGSIARMAIDGWPILSGLRRKISQIDYLYYR